MSSLYCLLVQHDRGEKVKRATTELRVFAAPKIFYSASANEYKTVVCKITSHHTAPKAQSKCELQAIKPATKLTNYISLP